MEDFAASGNGKEHPAEYDGPQLVGTLTPITTQVLRPVPPTSNVAVAGLVPSTKYFACTNLRSISNLMKSQLCESSINLCENQG